MELKIGDVWFYCNVKPKYTNGVKGYEIYYQKCTIEKIEVIEGGFRNIWYRDETGYQSSMYEFDFLDIYGKDKREAREKAIKRETKMFKSHIDRLTTLIYGEEKDG
jgi:hypothetical protein